MKHGSFSLRVDTYFLMVRSFRSIIMSNRNPLMKTQCFKATSRSKAFSGSGKRQIMVSEAYSPKQSTASYWNEGSRDYYTVFNRNDRAQFNPDAGTYPHFQAEHTLQPGDVLMETGFTQGKPSTPRFTCLKGELEEMKLWLGIESGTLPTKEF